jgi:hypothetical protein
MLPGHYGSVNLSVPDIAALIWGKGSWPFGLARRVKGFTSRGLTP